MVEMRWRKVYSKVLHQGNKMLLKTVLEYRQKIDTNIYAGTPPNNVTPKLEWSEWKEVPTVEGE